ncbi:MAG: hypothetical protein K940chlam5_01603, partial [Candidatus Anoxychlamydiales bacterium]|nr:hypothetical protein [Candidatus Anoxychlamydiales bacterium]
MKKNNFLNKTLFTLAAMLFSASAIAIPKDPCAPKDVCCEEPAPGPFAFAYPKDVGLTCPRNFYAHGEFLWMKPSEEGLEYVMDNDSGNFATFPLLNGQVKGFSRDSDEWDWRPGLRVGFGFYNNLDFWSFSADWTYLKIKSDSEIAKKGNGTLMLLYLPPNSISVTVRDVSARWSGDFNTLDLMIGKPYHVSRYFISNPKFGIKAAWIDQDFHIRYYDNSVLRKENIFLKNDFWGAGLRGYYEGQFLLGSGFCIYGKMAFALLFGKFDISQQAEFSQTGAWNYKTEDSFYSVQPNAELGLGFSWSRYYYKNQYQISL